MTLTFDLTYDLDLGCFKVKFRYSSISGIVGLIDVKWKRSELIWYWADCMTFPFDHTHDLDPGVEISRSKSEIALSQEWDGQLTWNEKDVSHPFMTMILTSVTMMGWADVPDSDWGDFRRRRAVDISSFIPNCPHLEPNTLVWCRSLIFRSRISNYIPRHPVCNDFFLPSFYPWCPLWDPIQYALLLRWHLTSIGNPIVGPNSI